MSLVLGDFHSKDINLFDESVEYYQAVEGSVVSIENLALLDRYSGPTSFDHCVIDFKMMFASKLNYAMSDEDADKYISSNKNWLHVVGARDFVNNAVNNISEIANKPTSAVRQMGLDVEYRKGLAELSAQLGDFVDGVEDNNELILVPLRGGLLVATLLPNFDIRRVIPIDCKRLPVKDEEGHFAFGMSFRYFADSTRNMLFDKYMSSKNSEIQILEVAIGSGMTTVGMMLDMSMRNIKPKKIRVIAPFITIPGIEIIKRVADFLNISIEVYTSAYFSRLGNYYLDRNDSILNKDGRYIVGNASDILSSFLHLNDLDKLFSTTHI